MPHTASWNEILSVQIVKRIYLSFQTNLSLISAPERLIFVVFWSVFFSETKQEMDLTGSSFFRIDNSY